MKIRITALCLALCMSVLRSTSLQAAGYTFTNIADGTTSPIGLKYLSFSISNGTAAVSGPYDGQSKSGLFATAGGPLTAVVKSGDAAPFGSFASSQFAISGAATSNGEFAFRGLYDVSKLGVFRINGGVITTIVNNGDPAPTGTFNSFGIVPDVSAGTVAFSAEYSSGGRGIFRGTGGLLTPVALRGDPSDIGTLTFFADPAIDDDTIVFSAQSATGLGIFASHAGSLTTIAKTGDAALNGSTFSNFSSPSVENGDVVFRGNYLSGQAIFRSDGVSLTPLVKSGDPSPGGSAFTEFGEPSVSHGAAAFWAKYAANDQGIFVANSGNVTNVIKKGDSLFGGTVDMLSFERLCLDDDGSGRLIFFYRLTNGRSGLAMASPVPEPHSGMLILFSLFAFRRRARVRSRRGCC